MKIVIIKICWKKECQTCNTVIYQNKRVLIRVVENFCTKYFSQPRAIFIVSLYWKMFYVINIKNT